MSLSILRRSTVRASFFLYRLVQEMRQISFVCLVMSIGVCTCSQGHAAPLTIAVELQSLTRKAFQQHQILVLHRKLLERLLQADFALQAPRYKTHLRISLHSTSAGLVVRVSGVGVPQQVSRSIRKHQGEMAQYHLEVVHKCLSTARLLRVKVKAYLQAQQARKKAMALLVQRQLPVPLLPKPPVRWGAEIDVGGALLHRLQGADFQGRLGFRWGQERGFGIYGSVFLTPFVSQDITIIEWGVQAGPTWRQPLGRYFSLEFGLLAGFLHHLYYFGLGQSGQDSRWDFLGNLIVLGNWHITRHVGFRVWLSLGLAIKSRVHRLDGETIWERSLLRLEGGVAFFLAF